MSKGSTNCPLSHPIQLPSPSFLGKMHHNAALLASNKCTAAENGQKGMNIIPSLHSRNLTLNVNKEVISNRKPEVLLKYRRCEWVAKSTNRIKSNQGVLCWATLPTSGLEYRPVGACILACVQVGTNASSATAPNIIPNFVCADSPIGGSNSPLG